jgi:hypothetical protein
MWQEEKGKPYYRFQTDEKQLADKMKRRNKFKLSAKGYNTNLWIFFTEISKPFIAKKMFNALSGESAVLNKNDDIFYQESYLSNTLKKSA